MSAGDSRLFLPCDGADALRFQRYGVLWLIPWDTSAGPHQSTAVSPIAVLSSINFQLVVREMRTPGWVKTRVPDSDVASSFHCDFCVSMIAREPTSDCSKEQNTALPWGRGHVHPCCRLALTSEPQPLLILHSTFAIASTVKNNEVRSFSSVTVASIVEVTIDNQRPAPGSAALRRSGTPGAPAKTVLHKCCDDTNMRREKSE